MATDEDADKFLMVSLEDSDSEKAKAIAEVLSSKTCKKIIGFLASASAGASQQDISKALSIPLNTLDYNFKKLLASGFIQKKKNFFWSKKGKKIIMYELSNKSIVISPAKASKTFEKFKSLIPAFLIVAAGTFASWAYEKVVYTRNAVYDSALKASENLMASGQTVPTTVASTSTLSSALSMPVWGWFLLGGIIALGVITIVNWRKL